MDLTPREAATVLGCNLRTLRARLRRGEVRGTKRGGRWSIPRDSLPLTEEQRGRLQRRADEIREAVEEALPSRAARRRGDRRRSVADLDSFRHGVDVWAELSAAEAAEDAPRQLAAARRTIESALLTLSQGAHSFDRERKLEELRRARAGFGRAVGLLLLARRENEEERILRWVETLEVEVLRSLAGLVRWAERLPGRRR